MAPGNIGNGLLLGHYLAGVVQAFPPAPDKQHLARLTSVRIPVTAACYPVFVAKYQRTGLRYQWVWFSWGVAGTLPQ